MKTIKIPEDLHRLLKVRAAELDRNLQELAEAAIRLGLPIVTIEERQKVAERNPKG